MSILLDADTRVIVQGISGRAGRFHTQQMVAYGTQIVAGVSPGKGGSTVDGIPVFNTVKEAVARCEAQASIVLVPPPFAADAIMEAADASLELCVAITEGIPAHDMIRVKRFLQRGRAPARTRLLGPNCAGVICPGKALLGIMPAEIYRSGRVGLIGRSGTLSYEAAAQIITEGEGISSSVGIGGDPIIGSSFQEILQLFDTDDETQAVLLVGEIGGSQEADAAEYIKSEFSKPVIAYIAGDSAPRGRTMGHAGAIISAFGDSADEKREKLREVGVRVIANPSEIGTTVCAALAELT
jgi:succinyl-CoA synthetase alpha subunit